ncbi:MAG: sigma-70 family RNA polymerase sigma factor [Phycisphaerales bacterium]|nr:sigma-70 family RNA polymerase sigma factor [Phycisphaerales bacterium]
MPMSMDPHEMTLLLHGASNGDREAANRLVQLVYDQLRALAGSFAGGHSANHTLQPTALVHEAFVKLVQSPSANYNDRGHFFAVAATAMRQILADHARRKRTAKRGGDATLQQPTNWDRADLASPAREEPREVDVVALDDLLAELARVDERRYRVVELRYFGGLEVEQVARLLDVSKSTVEADWRAARAWLAMRLSQ